MIRDIIFPHSIILTLVDTCCEVVFVNEIIVYPSASVPIGVVSASTQTQSWFLATVCDLLDKLLLLVIGIVLRVAHFFLLSCKNIREHRIKNSWYGWMKN